MNPERAGLVRYRLERARESLKAAQLLATNGHNHAAVNRLYYACFYAVSALLLNDNLSAVKHSGVFALFNQHWIKTARLPVEHGRLYGTLFDARQEADYADMTDFAGDKVRAWGEGAERLLAAIEKILSV